MSIFLTWVFIFILGSIAGWIIEIIYRKIKFGKLVNPGFLVGPYLPIYGFGLVFITIFHTILMRFNIHPLLIILSMGIIMTIIELLGGLYCIKQKVKLWDYSDEWLNYKGIICPHYTLLWILAGAIYYFFLYDPLIYAINWFNDNISFSYVIGIFSGFLLIDFFYSSKLYLKIRKYAKKNNIVVRYEKLKLHIKEETRKAEEKYFFLFPFRQSRKLIEYLDSYRDRK
ncbi:MAG: putative ABC transporter permease [Bacilli bacterium]|nr:putative ABC transporter permease [Bacilli bacterium]